MPAYVIGHKNPDTDAICSAIGYADLLSRTGREPAEAARCGDVNARTAFALEQAGLPAPKLVMDVRPTAGQISRRAVVTAGADESVMEVFDRMRADGFRSLPVIDADRNLLGMVSLTKTLDLLLPADCSEGGRARIVSSNLARIAKVLGGTLVHAVREHDEEDLLLTVGAMRADAFRERIEEYPPEKVLLVVGNRPSIQQPAIQYGVRAIVVTGGYEMEPALLDAARAAGTGVILSPRDTATTTLLIKCAQRVTHALIRDTLAFLHSAPIEKIRHDVAGSPLGLFPVLDDQGRLHGVFSKSDLVEPDRTKLILVDHNEFAQAVNGIEEAEVLEVIDHHRLGGSLVTREPIRFINEPLGSTCSIIAHLYRQRGVQPDSAIALCLATGIISDTLHLTSPTTTAEDREILAWLEPLAGRDLKKYAESFFAAGSALQVQTADQVVIGDCKEYRESGRCFGVAQVEELGLQGFWDRKEELRAALESLRTARKWDFLCLLVTDITTHYSVLLCVGDAVILDAIDYPRLEPGLFELQGIVSRKKQLLPRLIQITAQAG